MFCEIVVIPIREEMKLCQAVLKFRYQGCLGSMVCRQITSMRFDQVIAQ